MGPGTIPLGLVDAPEKAEEGAIAKGKADTKAYVEEIRRQAAASKEFYDGVNERLKKLGPLPGLPKIPASNELPSTAGPVIKPEENDPKRDYAPLGPSPALTQRDVQGDPQPAGGAQYGTGGPDDPGGPPVPVRESQKPAGEQKPPAAPKPPPPPQNAYKGLQYAPPKDWRPAQDRPGIGEMLWASARNVWLNQSSNSEDEALQRVYNEIIFKARKAGISLPENPILQAQASVQGSITVPSDAFVQEWHEKVKNMLDANPAARDALGPITKQALSEMADGLSREAQDQYEQLKQQRGEGFWSLDTLAEFGVGMAASMNDPMQRQMMLFGGTSKTILEAAVKEGAINALTDAMLEPGIQSRQLAIGNIDSWEEGIANAVNNIGVSAALGFVLGGGGKAVEKMLDGRGTRPSAQEVQTAFDHAKDALTAVAADMAPQDPETAAIVRKALGEAERDYSTAQQYDDRLMPAEFARAVEDADAQMRGLQEFLERPQVLPDGPERVADITDDGPTPKVGETLKEDGKPVTFTQFDPRRLGVAPDEFQYKRFSGDEGVNGAISDVETWHAPSSGKILVFERNNGELVVADGHQRRSKALSLMAQGQEDIRLDGYLYREADGWTPSDLRLKGAQKNIREGRSDVLDTAQALRERPDAIDSSFPLSRSNIRQARQLARLAPEAWDLTRAGVLDPHYAALIGQVAPDRPGIHAPLARTLIEAQPDNLRQAESIVSEALLDYAERDTSTQASLFGDDNLGRGVMYKERAQIMDAAYSWLRSERSVFKALVEKGDIARALGNELVDAANLNAKDQVDLAIAAVMHSRRAGVRTAVSDMVSRALDSVRREGVSPTRAGQQVAREIRALVEERGFRALLEAEGPPPPQPAEAGPLFDGPGTPAHVAQADMLEGDLRPEGIEPPKVDLAEIAKPQDEVAGLVDELKGAGEGGGDRTPDQILNDIKKLLEPKKEGEGAKGPKTPEEEFAAAKKEFQQLMQTENALRDALFGLTDEQKISLVRMQYPDAYAVLNRLAGTDLDDAIVGRVMAGEIKYAKRGAPDAEITYKRFYNDAINPKYNKIIEMALNGISNLDIAIEIGTSVSTVKSMMSRAKKQLAKAGVVVDIEPGQTGRAMDGHGPGALKAAVIELAEKGEKPIDIFQKLTARGEKTTIAAVHTTYWRWRQAKQKGVKFAVGTELPPEIPTFPKLGYEARDLILMFNDGLAFDRMGAELGYALNKPINPSSLRVQTTNIRTALRKLRENPERFREAAGAMAISEDELNTFIDKLGERRAPSVAAEARRLLRDGETDNKVIFEKLRDYVDKHRLDFNTAEHTLAETVSHARASLDLGLRPRSSVGVDPHGATPDELFDRLTAEFGDGAAALTRMGEINIVDTPPAWADPATMGFTDAQGRVTIVASNVSPDDVRGLILHEIGVHVGLPQILGDEGFDQLLDQIRRRAAADDAAVMAAYRRVPADTDPNFHAEETLAYLIQHAPKTPWLQQVFADIRAWLYRTFPAVRDWMTLTDADLQSLAIGAVRRRMKEADWSVVYSGTHMGGVFAEPARFALKRQKVEIDDATMLRAAAELRPAEFEAWKAAAEGLSNREIAERLGGASGRVTETYARSLLSRARQKGFETQRLPKGLHLSFETRRVLQLKAQAISNKVIAERVYPERPIEAARNQVNVLVSQHKDIIDRLRAGEDPFSTGPVKYARRPRGSENPSDSSGSEVSGGARQPGRADVSANGGTGAGAPERGAVQPGSFSGRAVATEPLPKAPADAELIEWNERVNLSAEQRAERREQFREFVDNAEVVTTSQKFMAEWDIRSGKMVDGRGRMVESRVYHVGLQKDWHPEWNEALALEETAVRVEIHKGEAIIPESHVAPPFRSTGLGKKLYMRAIDDMLAAGLVVNSDMNVSENAIAMWKSLRNQGYDVVQRVPDNRLERGEDGMYSHDGEPISVFFIARKKPAAPELPVSNRDLSNAIDEQRSLTEHMPVCLAGKRRA